MEGGCSSGGGIAHGLDPDSPESRLGSTDTASATSRLWRSAAASEGQVTLPIPLTVPEARAILAADKALYSPREAGLTSVSLFGAEEREAWRFLVESAADRAAAYSGTPHVGGAR